MFTQAILKTVHYILSEVIKGFKWKRKYKCKSQWSWKLLGRQDNNANDNFQTYKVFVCFSFI